MRPTTVFLCLLFAFGVLFSINLQVYLYAGENQTGTEKFTALNSSYTLIFINGKETLLLKGDALVSDQGEIESALYQYYLSKYYPSKDEIQNIANLLNAYHASRENGDMWEGYEEKTCRTSLFLDSFPCTNSSTPSFTNYSQMKGNNCYLTASLLCDQYGDELGCEDPSQILKMVQDFALSSNDMTRIQNETNAELAAITPENAYGTFTKIKSDMGQLSADEVKLETTKFRIPMGGQKECRDCIGLCPPVIINEQYLKDAGTHIDALLPNLQKVDGYKAEAKSIYDSTLARQGHYTSSTLQEYYTSLFAPEKARAEKALGDADELLLTIDDSTVRENSARIRTLISGIETGMQTSKFDDINASRAELDAKVVSLEKAIPASQKTYNDTVDAKDQASAIMFTLDTMTVPTDLQGNVSALKATKRTQDRSFSTGLSPQRYSELKDKYDSISLEGATIIEQTQGGAQGKVVDAFKGAGRKTNEGIAGLATTVVQMQREDKEQVSSYAPIVLSSLSFFSLSSLAIFLFLFAFATFANLFRNRVMMFFWFIVLGAAIIFAGVISYGAYVVLSTSSSDATFTDFKGYVLDSSDVSILVETQNVSTAASTAMLECAGNLSASFEGVNATIYDKKDGECTVNGQGVTLAECYNTIKEPIIEFKYSPVDESPEFSTGFVYKGTFSGDEEYFTACEVSKAFKSTDIMDMVKIKLPQASGNASNASSNSSGNSSGG